MSVGMNWISVKQKLGSKSKYLDAMVADAVELLLQQFSYLYVKVIIIFLNFYPA